MADFNIAINLKANDLGASQVIKGLTGNVRQLGKAGQGGLGGPNKFFEAHAFQQAGRGVSRFARAARAGIGGAVTAAANLEQELANVRAVTNDARNIATDPAAKKNFTELTALAKELGATTEFTAVQAAEGLKFLGIAGFNSTQQLQAMPAVLDLATAASVDLGKSSDVVSDIMGGFGIEADKTRQVTDVLAKTFTSSNTTLPLLGRSLFKVGQLSKTAGISLTEMAAASGFLANKGIKGAEAGTLLRNVLLSITGKATPKAAAALKSLGTTSTKLKAAFDEKGLGGALALIGTGMSKLETGSKKLAKAEAIFGKRGAGGGVDLAAGIQSGELTTLTTELENAGGATEDIAAVMRDTAANQIKLFESALDGLKVQIGNDFIPILREMMPKILELATVTSDWLVENKDSIPTMAKVALAMAAISTVGGPLLTLMGGLKMVAGGLGIKFGGIRAASGGAGKAMAGLGLAAGAAGVAFAGSAAIIGVLRNEVAALHRESDALAKNLSRNEVGIAAGLSDEDLAAREKKIGKQAASERARFDKKKNDEGAIDFIFGSSLDESAAKGLEAQELVLRDERLRREKARPKSLNPKQIDLGTGRNRKTSEAANAQHVEELRKQTAALEKMAGDGVRVKNAGDIGVKRGAGNNDLEALTAGVVGEGL